MLYKIKNVKLFKLPTSILFIIIFSSCRESNKLPTEVNKRADHQKQKDSKLSYYIFENIDFITQKTYREEFSAKEMEELQKKTPLFVSDSCSKYSPDSFYDKYSNTYTEKIEIERGIDGFKSEAGKDALYKTYAMLLRKKLDDQFNTNNNFRLELLAVLQNINSIFHCVSKGGTMYYHLSERMPAYVEWYLLNGEKNHFKVEQVFSPKDIEKKIRDVCKSYQTNYDSTCIHLSEFKKQNNYYWLMDKAFSFVHTYE